MKKVLFILPLFISTIFALAAPSVKGRVNDYAGVLSADATSRIEQKLAALETSDSTQIVVLTVPTLDGDSIEDFSMRVVEQWKLGQKGLDNGALLIIAKDDRKLRIEVGYGLEGKLTDALSGRIIRQVIVPHFKQNDFEGGVEAGVDAMIAATKGEFTLPDRSFPISKDSLFIILVLLVFFLRIFMRGILGRRSYYGGHRGSGGGFFGGGGGGGGGFSGGGGGFGGGGSSGGW